MRTLGPPRKPLDGEHFEVVVIGGGINGTAIARECARARRRTLIVEQHDFGAGTTSRSTRIIHGGLRYLEHGEISLVRDSLRERERLLRERSHLVRPLRFLLALDKEHGRSALEVRFGLWLYHRLAGTRRSELRSIAELEPMLDGGRRWATFAYDDAQCAFPERLVAVWLTEAITAGATARNYTELHAVESRGGRVRAVLLQDRFEGREARVQAERIINATGPWADRICRQSGIDTARPMIGGVRGSHLVLPQFAGAPRSAVYSEAVDGRPVFVVPWNGQVLVGTTEAPDDRDPAAAQASEAEIEYLFDALVKLFPRAAVAWSDIRYSFAGVRPLPYMPGLPPAAVTRRHILQDHTADGAAGMISVIGGKLTTAASLARACARAIGIRSAGAEPVAIMPVPADGIQSLAREWSRQLAAATGIPEASVRAAAEWFGPRAEAIVRRATGDERLRRRLCPHSAHLAAEAVYAVEHECALTLADILLRRVPVALGECWSEQCAQSAAAHVGAALGWSEAETAEQLEAFDTERRQFLRAPQWVSTRRRARESASGDHAA